MRSIGDRTNEVGNVDGTEVCVFAKHVTFHRAGESLLFYTLTSTGANYILQADGPDPVTISRRDKEALLLGWELLDLCSLLLIDWVFVFVFG